MEISTELLVADLAQKLRRGLIDPHGPNLEDDLRAAIVLAQHVDALHYDHLSDEIKDAPMTYLPALLKTCVEASIEKRVFFNVLGFVRGVVEHQDANGAGIEERHKLALALIADCQNILTNYLVPDGLSEQDCLSKLLELLDGPRSRAVLPPVDKPQPSA